jgi:hypothetical protein
MEETYRVVRFCFDSSDPQHHKVIKTGLTLDEAQEHCQDPETSSRTASELTLARVGIADVWFDGYQPE